MSQQHAQACSAVDAFTIVALTSPDLELIAYRSRNRPDCKHANARLSHQGKSSPNGSTLESASLLCESLGSLGPWCCMQVLHARIMGLNLSRSEGGARQDVSKSGCKARRGAHVHHPLPNQPDAGGAQDDLPAACELVIGGLVPVHKAPEPFDQAVEEGMGKRDAEEGGGSAPTTSVTISSLTSFNRSPMSPPFWAGLTREPV
jgi:hypothetical protein